MYRFRIQSGLFIVTLVPISCFICCHVDAWNYYLNFLNDKRPRQQTTIATAEDADAHGNCVGTKHTLESISPSRKAAPERTRADDDKSRATTTTSATAAKPADGRTVAV